MDLFANGTGELDVFLEGDLSLPLLQPMAGHLDLTAPHRHDLQRRQPDRSQLGQPAPHPRASAWRWSLTSTAMGPEYP